MLPIPPQPGRYDRAWYRCALIVAMAAGAFCVVIAAGLVWRHFNPPIERDPAPIAALKAQLVQEPSNDALKQRIRVLDVQVRREDQRRRAQVTLGAYLLLVGVGVLLASAKTARAYRPQLPAPPTQGTGTAPAQDRRAPALARGAVALLGVLLLSAAAIAGLTSSRQAPWRVPDASAAAVTHEPPAPFVPPSPAEVHANWPRFRGPDGSGICMFANIPSEWNGPTGKGVIWKMPIPLPGQNSPVVWGNRVFLSGADKGQGEIYCLDAATGAILWRRCVPFTAARSKGVGGSEVPARAERSESAERFEGREERVPLAAYAAPTVAVDGTHVCAIFYQGKLACLDWAGNPIWQKDLDVTGDSYGHANSLLMWQDRLIVQLDRAKTKDGKFRSALLALNLRDGQVIWQTPRPVGGSWATPILIGAASLQRIITASEPWVMSYDPQTGAEQWRIKCLRDDAAPSPIFAGGLIVVVQPAVGSETLALRPDGSGDVTATHIVWRNPDIAPDISSPVASDQLLFQANSDGAVVCCDLTDGKELWRQQFEGSSFQSSPSLVGDKLYVLDTQGVMFILAADRTFRQIGRAELGEECYASPAFAPGRIFLRGASNLYCIGSGGAP